MPIYDYRCRECGQVHEVFLQRADAAPERCPSCGSEDLERLLSTFNIRGDTLGTGGLTCCGSDERCDIPPCSTDGSCRRS